MYVDRAMYSFRMSFWTVPRSDPRATPRASPTLFRSFDGRVDRHARAHPIEREASEQGVHVLDRRNRDADASDLAAGHWCIAVVAHLRRQVERDAQPFVALGEEVLEPPVRLLRGPETSILAHRPEPTAVHRRMDATGEGRLPRESDAFPVYVRL